LEELTRTRTGERQHDQRTRDRPNDEPAARSPVAHPAHGRDDLLILIGRQRLPLFHERAIELPIELGVAHVRCREVRDPHDAGPFSCYPGHIHTGLLLGGSMRSSRWSSKIGIAFAVATLAAPSFAQPDKKDPPKPPAKVDGAKPKVDIGPAVVKLKSGDEGQ